MRLARLVPLLIAATPALAQNSLPQERATPRAPPADHMLRIPGLPAIPLPPGARAFGPQTPPDARAPDIGVDDDDDGPLDPRRRPAPPARLGAPATPPAKTEKPARRAPVSVPTVAAQRARVLDALFERLLGASADEAPGVAEAIERVFGRSGSETVDVVMTRARAALDRQQPEVAERLVDAAVGLAPDWADGFAQRAALRAIRGDTSGAIADYAVAVRLEPRHFQAQNALGALRLKEGDKAGALDALRRSLELYPAQAALAKKIEQLRLDVEGRDI